MKQPSIFDAGVAPVLELARQLAEQIQALPVEQQIEALNSVRALLHEAGPFRDEPVDLVTWVPADSVVGNDYNPNWVAPPEMKLLARSIAEDGYTQPIVGWRENEHVEVVDGFHRTRIGRENTAIRKRLGGYLPVTTVNSSRADRKDRMASTIRHNRARGVHGVRPMTEIVAELMQLGWSDYEIATELGMDADEVLRFKQNTGMAGLFKNHEYGRAWE